MFKMYLLIFIKRKFVFNIVLKMYNSFNLIHKTVESFNMKNCLKLTFLNVP